MFGFLYLNRAMSLMSLCELLNTGCRPWGLAGPVGSGGTESQLYTVTFGTGGVPPNILGTSTQAKLEFIASMEEVF